MASEKNPFNAWFFFVMPIFIFIAIYQLIPAISEHLIPDLMGQIIYYGVATIIGFFLFRNSRTIRDHEWHRQRQIKSLQKDYAAEDRGVWSKADLAMSELEADARGIESGQMSRKALERLDGSIAELTSERLTSEVDREDQDQENVALFSESEHVRRSTSRVTGESGPVLSSGSDDWYAQEMRGVSTIETAVSSASTPRNVCSSCGWNNPESTIYCENCGDKL